MQSLQKCLSFASLAFCMVSASSFAQINGFTGQVLTPIPPDREFSTSEEHYQYLLDNANGGTQHTLDSVPRWDGLWYTSGNNHMDLFVDGGLRGGTVREGVLTPAYEAAYKERWRQQIEEGQVRYDRLTIASLLACPVGCLSPTITNSSTCRTSPGSSMILPTLFDASISIRNIPTWPK